VGGKLFHSGRIPGRNVERARRGPKARKCFEKGAGVLPSSSPNACELKKGRSQSYEDRKGNPFLPNVKNGAMRTSNLRGGAAGFFRKESDKRGDHAGTVYKRRLAYLQKKEKAERVSGKHSNSLAGWVKRKRNSRGEKENQRLQDGKHVSRVSCY